MRLPGILATLALCVPAGAAAQDTLAIERVTVIPMTRDTALADHTVIVARDRIVWVGRARDAHVPSSARRIDGRGRFLIPGLVDMHVHLEEPQDLTDYVAAGVTTVRNMGGIPQHVAWRDSIARGQRFGPTIVTTGPLCCRGLIPRDRFVRITTPAAAEAAVRTQKAAGYDMIKAHSRISAVSYERLVQAARAARMAVVGHHIPEIGLARQLAAGQVSFEHYGDLGPADEAARAIASKGAWVGTVLSGGKTCGAATDADRQIFAAFKRAHVKLLAGTDATLGEMRAGDALHCELEMLVSAGLTAYEALASATSNAGAFMQAHGPPSLSPFGTVTVGSRADLVLLPADPRLGISTIRQPAAVVLRGRVVN